MSKLTPQSGQDIVRYNISQIYHIPKRYTSILYFIKESPLRRTLLSILHYIEDKELIIDRHRYEFILPTNRLTNEVRRKRTGRAISSRHVNMLCAMGFLKKIPQTEEAMLDINRKWLAEQKENGNSSRPMNVFSFSRYTEKELDRIEERAGRLKAAGITAGNISSNNLSINGCEDLATEVYYANNRTAPERKMAEASQLFAVMEMLIERDGYTTREQIRENLVLPDSEIDQLFKIFRIQIGELYKYAPPTKAQMEQWGLKSRKYIYLNKHDSS